MAIDSICKTDVVTVPKNSTLKDVSTLMQKYHVGSVIVVESFDGKKFPAGIITDRDIALSISSSAKPQNIMTEDIMRHQPVTAKKSEGIFESIIKMRENGVKRLPVVNEDGSLHGVVCVDDLLTLMGEEINNLAQVTDSQLKREKGIRVPMEPHLQL